MSFGIEIARFPSMNPSAVSIRQQEELINAYEAEEEKIINDLSRKLEQLRQDKIDLENVMEAESESHVNRLQRELAAWKTAFRDLQQQQQQHHHQQGSGPAPGDVDGSTMTTASHGSTSGSGTRPVRITPSQLTTSLSTASTASDLSATSSMTLNDGFSADSPISPDRPALGFRSFMTAPSSVSRLSEPTPEVMLETMRRENEQLRSQLFEKDRDYVRISRLNEIYREELIEHRRRLGISVDSLIGLASDPFIQPNHHRHSSSSGSFAFDLSASSSPTSHFYGSRNGGYQASAGGYNGTSTTGSSRTNGVPIPHPPSQMYRPKNRTFSEANTPLSHSPGSVSTDSQFPFSPIVPSSGSASVNPTSISTTMTSPSSGPFGQGTMLGYIPGSARTLSYPSVPPPSLSSSFGSPSVPFFVSSGRDASLSPIEPLSRRNSVSSHALGGRRGSVGGERRVVETGSLVRSAAGSRRASFDRGARVAETGSLLGGQNHLQSVLSETVDEGVDVEVVGTKSR